jgi:hypothetical protein
MKQQHNGANRSEGSDKKPKKKASGAAPRRGLTVPKTGKDGKAPPVDEELLRALVRQELPEQQAREVFALIHTYTAWDDAHERALLEHIRAQKKGKG